MDSHFSLTIRLYDDHYHGVAEWPPAPARVFQALVAGAAEGAKIPAASRTALEWLEKLPPPTIACPRAQPGQSLGIFVPNNDADSLGGDLSKLPDIRVKKTVRPRLLTDEGVFVYMWPLEAQPPDLAPLIDVCERLYQLGRGIDPAWAAGAIVDDAEAERILSNHVGVVHRPSVAAGASTLACPTVGTLTSLSARHRAGAMRLREEADGKAARVLFAQPPKPRFVEVAYDAAPTRLLYDLRRATDDTEAFPVPLWRVVSLVEQLRDGAAARLRDKLPDRAGSIDRVLVGRKADGSNSGPIADRVRILPVPSIGHAHADQVVRRVAVLVPTSCPIGARDVHWAFSGLEPFDATTGEVDFVVIPADDPSMADRLTGPSRTWHTVTPAALPESAGRRRIEPTRRREEAKRAPERADEERAAILATRAALRHVNIDESPVRIAVQREPFDGKGTRAERFATASSRFCAARLWHVRVEFRDPVAGPLALGDGRFLGLGLLAPSTAMSSDSDGVIALDVIDGLVGEMSPIDAAKALRRALMARAQHHAGRRSLPTFVTGHDVDGSPARGDVSTHVAFHAAAGRLWIIAPHRLDRRPATRGERTAWKGVEQAIEGFTELRAGRLGVLALQRAVLAEDEELLQGARSWCSLTPYRVQRHERAANAREAVLLDVVAECARRGLPRPDVKVHHLRAERGHGLEADLELQFATAIPGPLALGRSRFLGGGLFTPKRRDE